MTDVLTVLGLVVFFALSAGFVAVCARIIGPDPEGVTLASGPDTAAAAIASDAEMAA